MAVVFCDGFDRYSELVKEGGYVWYDEAGYISPETFENVPSLRISNEGYIWWHYPSTSNSPITPSLERLKTKLQAMFSTCLSTAIGISIRTRTLYRSGDYLQQNWKRFDEQELSGYPLGAILTRPSV